MTSIPLGKISKSGLSRFRLVSGRNEGIHKCDRFAVVTRELDERPICASIPAFLA